jgi:hypothetical protein
LGRDKTLTRLAALATLSRSAGEGLRSFSKKLLSRTAGEGRPSAKRLVAEGSSFQQVAITRPGETVKSKLSWVAAAVACAVVLVLGFLIAALWIGIGDSEISGAGWLAMGLGVIVTLALGIGLMALVFISSRRGYDEIGRGDG